MWVSFHYQDTDFTWPLSLDDKIDIFVDRVYGWQLDIADQCINSITRPDGNITNPIPGAGFAALHIVLSYFEMVGKFRDGYVKKGKSEYYFREGMFAVFPMLRTFPPTFVDKLLEILYSGGRCGLYHGGMTDPHVIITGEISNPLSLDEQNDILIINPHKLIPAMKDHLAAYAAELRDPNNGQLRRNFELRFDFESAP